MRFISTQCFLLNFFVALSLKTSDEASVGSAIAPDQSVIVAEVPPDEQQAETSVSDEKSEPEGKYPSSTVQVAKKEKEEETQASTGTGSTTAASEIVSAAEQSALVGSCSASEGALLKKKKAYSVLMKECLIETNTDASGDCVGDKLKGISLGEEVKVHESGCSDCWRNLIQSVGTLPEKVQQECKSDSSSKKCTSLINDKLQKLTECTGIKEVFSKNGAASQWGLHHLVVLLSTVLVVHM